MAEIVSSALVQETVGQIISNLVQKYEDKDESSANRNLERLEMAHIRLEAALETSEKWQISDTSLLRWRGKLKRAAQECDETLHRCKQRILEAEQTEEEVRKSSFPVRIAHTTKSFVFSIFGPNKDVSNSSAVRRFEWFANGASEFLRLLEFGGRPRYHMPFDHLVNHMKQRIVIMVQITCDKCRKNSLALACSTYGVHSVRIEGEEKDQLVVVGHGVDATSLTRCLRKKVKVGRADIVKVEALVDVEATRKPADETAPASSSNSDPVAGSPPHWYPYHPGYYCPAGPGIVRPYAGHCYVVEDPCADEGSVVHHHVERARIDRV